MIGLARRPAALRLLLLAVLAFGVVGMHTTSHSPLRHQPSAAGHTAASNMAMVATPPGTVLAMISDRETPSGGMNGSQVCLAVLVGIGLVVLVAALARAAGALGGSALAPAPLVAPSGRGPPPTPVGLRLADLSVLRR